MSASSRTSQSVSTKIEPPAPLLVGRAVKSLLIHQASDCQRHCDQRLTVGANKLARHEYSICEDCSVRAAGSASLAWSCGRPPLAGPIKLLPIHGVVLVACVPPSTTVNNTTAIPIRQTLERVGWDNADVGLGSASPQQTDPRLHLASVADVPLPANDSGLGMTWHQHLINDASSHENKESSAGSINADGGGSSRDSVIPMPFCQEFNTYLEERGIKMGEDAIFTAF
ncbi:hypothetical protein M426DRAFT_17293 [Hypoxylon sp. CI-4A]|nr:hypothetical protein M426DRAFT_17293 [Hypoxylon sp. CI-4A]